MIGAFLFGGAFQFLDISRRLSGPYQNKVRHCREIIYQVVIFYLLFKIGFSGGVSIITEPLEQVLFTTAVAGVAAVIWALFLLQILKTWSGFSRLTQISIAAHFGSVSVGTFVAGLAFMAALSIEVPGSVAVWLAMMELPAILVGMWKLNINFKQVFKILIEDRSLMVLLVAIALGIWGGELVPTNTQTFLFKTIFTPILVYFLFEMGRKATSSFSQLKGQIGSVIMVGIAVPILGGLLGVSVGSLLGYDTGQMFMLGLLMASASYVLAPISVQQILNSLYHPTAPEIKNVVAISMALSVGVALPFNVLVGFELYHSFVKVVEATPNVAYLGIVLPLLVLLLTKYRPQRSA